jgi:hypothetical protein
MTLAGAPIDSVDYAGRRALAGAVYLFSGLAVGHWYHVGQVFRQPPVWCGNVITDPLLLLMNWFAPLCLMCVIALWRSRRGRRVRPVLPIAVLPLFLGTLAGLAVEAVWLRDYGINLSHCVWWFPWL